MKRLGYKTYVSQGGDWGSVVADKMAAQKPVGLLGIHVNMPATVPADIAKLLASGSPAPAGLSAKEKLLTYHLIIYIPGRWICRHYGNPSANYWLQLI
jgi:hypothetical protein